MCKFLLESLNAQADHLGINRKVNLHLEHSDSVYDEDEQGNECKLECPVEEADELIVRVPHPDELKDEQSQSGEGIDFKQYLVFHVQLDGVISEHFPHKGHCTHLECERDHDTY
jgi:hypothetical protein